MRAFLYLALAGSTLLGCDDEPSKACGGDAADAAPCPPEAAAPEVQALAPVPVKQPDGSIVMVVPPPPCRDEMAFPNLDHEDRIPVLQCSLPAHHAVAVPYGEKHIALLCSCHDDGTVKPLDGGK